MDLRIRPNFVRYCALAWLALSLAACTSRNEAPPSAGLTVTTEQCTSDPDGNTINLAVIRPDSDTPLPCVYYIHGGGMAMMSARGATLNIIDSTIVSNTSGNQGGGVAVVLTGGTANVTVSGSTIGRNTLNGEHRAVDPLEHVDQLLHRRRVGVNHVIGQDDSERLAAHQFSRHEHRVTKAERLALPDVGEVDHVRDLANLGELFTLAAGLEK